MPKSSTSTENDERQRTESEDGLPEKSLFLDQMKRILKFRVGFEKINVYIISYLCSEKPIPFYNIITVR